MTQAKTTFSKRASYRIHPYNSLNICTQAASGKRRGNLKKWFAGEPHGLLSRCGFAVLKSRKMNFIYCTQAFVQKIIFRLRLVKQRS